MLMHYVRNIRVRIPVRPEPSPALIPDCITLRYEARSFSSFCYVVASEDVLSVLIGVSDNYGHIPVVMQQWIEVFERFLHFVEVLLVAVDFADVS